MRETSITQGAKAIMRAMVYSVSAAVLLAMIAAIAPSRADEFLVNGGFETMPFGSGWTIAPSGTPYVTDHQGLTATGLDVIGSHAAHYSPPAAITTITQTGFNTGKLWQLDFLFACEQVTGSGKDRSLNFAVPHNSAGQINMRIGANGKLQVYETGRGWYDLSPGAIGYSIDVDDNGSFADAGDVLNVHSLRVVGNYGAIPYYDVYMSAANSVDLQLVASHVRSWHNGTPNGYVKEMFFTATNATGGAYVVDQVSLQSLAPPEPRHEVYNGSFEATPFDDDWVNGDGVHRVASIHRGLSATGLDAVGTQAALLRKATGTSTDLLYQDNLDVGSRWQLDFLFASSPIAAGGTRSLNFTLHHDGGFINMRLEPDGMLSTYDAHDRTWHKFSDKAVDFSTDGNGDGDFDDAGDVLNVHSLRIVGNYADESPYYNVFLSDANSDELDLIGSNIQYWHSSDPEISHPESGDYIGEFRFATLSSDGVYLVDEVSLKPLEIGDLKPGDANCDTIVNAADAKKLAANWLKQSGATWEEGDFNDDGKVDDKDAALMAANWTTAASASVPEPSMLVLTVIGIFALTIKTCVYRNRMASENVE